MRSCCSLRSVWVYLVCLAQWRALSPETTQRSLTPPAGFQTDRKGASSGDNNFPVIVKILIWLCRPCSCRTRVMSQTILISEAANAPLMGLTGKVRSRARCRRPWPPHLTCLAVLWEEREEEGGGGAGGCDVTRRETRPYPVSAAR